ncbi:HNH endonuclease [Vibrio splendidus]
MSKYQFSAAQRHAIWTVHNEKCYLCTRPVDFNSMQVDHVLPESLLEDKFRLAQVLVEFGLPADFDLNSYVNWLPACAPCNNQKSNDVYNLSPILLAQLNKAQSKSEKAASIEAEVKSDRKISLALNTLEQAAETGQLTEEMKAKLEPLVDYQKDHREIEYAFNSIRLTADYKVSPGREDIIQRINNYLGLEFVRITPEKSLILAFDGILREMGANRSIHAGIPLNGGGMIGLMGAGVLDRFNRLTPIGVTILKQVAQEQEEAHAIKRE